ncbi:N-acetylmuramoyl-L-alanine amidase family protein [Caldithrix abyssi]|uniref:N-acetylmuramoyl-L-alanine amidase n=1 Tax=Caldithrix abyssi DSM 13497 TaxID=880073 RepID=H1XUU3_CALAY|nr:N-acetylmuramoyl-L-alanine amidase [Caldithrix abyssi]APF17546.1 N-acetylmuramoyl-L-alanine amidase [Caldithrix abyssi DSM 13497]EHO41642.1 cell wall hydrolase/autolysin [Caldithrix abyssi DSM 13497]
MFRRKFLKKISYGIGLALFNPLHWLRAQERSLLKIEKDGRIIGQIPFLLKQSQCYIKLTDFADLNHLGQFTNTSRRKTLLIMDQAKFKFTHDNSFVVVNDRALQILYAPFWKEGALWVAVAELVELINEFTQYHLQFDDVHKLLRFTVRNINITSIQIEHKSNGTLIALNATRSFAADDLKTKMVNGWLYLEIVGGRGEEKALSRKINDSTVREIRAAQLDQLLSIGFHLKKEPQAYEALYDDVNGQILLTVHEKTIQKDNPEKTDDAQTQSIDEELERQKSEWMIHTIVIDPGHGGKDPGAVGYYKLKEKDIVLSVGLLLGDYLKKRLPGVKILYTRDRDVFIPLWKRTKFANENQGRLFISLHCNSSKSRRARGFETYFLSAEKDEKAREVVLTENESIKFETAHDQKRYEGINFVLATLAQNAFIKYSQYLASVVQKMLRKFLRPLGMKDRGVKQGPFWVMVGATMPNILVEMGYISNKNEAKLLRRKSTQSKIALALAEGIVKFKNDFESAL